MVVPGTASRPLDSLRPYLIEEAYEVLDAMDDAESHRRELGDLLLQIVFQSALREREGAFDLKGVIAAIREKMIRRHPHVFGPRAARQRGPGRGGGVSPVGADQAGRARRCEWTAAAARGDSRALPALQRAWRLQDKAAKHAGFDWPSVEGPAAKIREEWEELNRARAEGDPEHVREEFGDLLFVMVRYGQKLGFAAEDALRATCAKFEARFGHHDGAVPCAGHRPGDRWPRRARRVLGRGQGARNGRAAG